MRRSKTKSGKGLLFISILFGLAFIVVMFLLIHQMSDLFGTNHENQNSAHSTIIDESEGYTLHQNATPYQIELFDELTAAHELFEASRTDESLKEYASVIVRNFVADFYTLSRVCL